MWNSVASHLHGRIIEHHQRSFLTRLAIPGGDTFGVEMESGGTRRNLRGEAVQALRTCDISLRVGLKASRQVTGERRERGLGIFGGRSHHMIQLLRFRLVTLENEQIIPNAHNLVRGVRRAYSGHLDGPGIGGANLIEGAHHAGGIIEAVGRDGIFLSVGGVGGGFGILQAVFAP